MEHLTFDAQMEAARAEILKTMGANVLTPYGWMPRNPDDVHKASLDISSGQYGISLEAPAKQLVPYVPSPWVGMAREVIPTGNTHTYKRITNVAVTGKSTAAEGTKGNAAAFTTDSKSVTFGIMSSGVFDVTYEAERAGGTFDDLLARATTNALLNGRRIEGAHLFDGTISALGACTNVAVSDNGATPAGNLANVTYYVNVKALNGPAMQKAILAGACYNTDASTYAFVPAAKATVDQTDGWGVEGTEANVTPTATHSMLMTWDAKAGAAGYGVFLGTTTGIANLKCIGVTTQCKIVIVNVPITGCTAGISGDNSADAYDMDSWLSLVVASGSGAYTKALGAGLSTASGNGIPEIDSALSAIYQQALGVDDIDLVMGPQMRSLITRKLGIGAQYSLARINIAAGPENTFAGGAFANKYVHPLTGRLLDIVVDPYQFGGMIEFVPKSVPFPMANVPAPQKVYLSYDWVNFAYAITDPKRTYENRMRGGVAVYLPPACGVIYNIWNT